MSNHNIDNIDEQIAGVIGERCNFPAEGCPLQPLHDQPGGSKALALRILELERDAKLRILLRHVFVCPQSRLGRIIGELGKW